MKDGKNETIAGYLFASCRIDYPYSNAQTGLLLSDELYLTSNPYIDDEHWRSGADDYWKTVMASAGNGSWSIAQTCALLAVFVIDKGRCREPSEDLSNPEKVLYRQSAVVPAGSQGSTGKTPKNSVRSSMKKATSMNGTLNGNPRPMPSVLSAHICARRRPRSQPPAPRASVSPR